jgi:signal transduction histidine kinase
MTGLPATGWKRRRALAFDVLLAAGLGLMLGGASVQQVGVSSVGLFAVAGITGFMQVAPLVWRRTHPTQVFAICTGAALVQWLAGIPLMAANVGLLFALYAITVYGPVQASRVGLGVGLIGAVLAAGRYYGDADTRGQITSWIAMAAVVLGVWALGERRRTRALYVAQLEARAAQLERDRDREAKLAVTAERTRIAREIHDVVAHGLSIMIVQADGGLYAADAAPEQAKKALATIADTGRDALAEMRTLLGLLKTDAPAYDDRPRPQPGVSQLPELVANVREAGMDVEMVVHGTVRELPALLGLTAYRVVQEALTNGLKHAGPGAKATVELTYGEAELTILVADDGHGAAAAAPDQPGHGLSGMRQRVSVTGGTVTAGPRAGGGYQVLARLPYDL